MKSKGSVLIVVLWLLFFLGMLALAINKYVFSQLDLAAKLKNRAKVYYLAAAAGKLAMLEVDKNKEAVYDALNDAWSSSNNPAREIILADGSFKYEITDEESKININTAPEWLLKNLFLNLAQVDEKEAGASAAAIIDWRKNNGSFRVKEELLLVKGITQEIYARFQDEITVYSSGMLNINTMDKVVLSSLGLESSLVDRIISFRQGSDAKAGTSDDNIFNNSAMILSLLAQSEKLSEGQRRQLGDILSSGFIGVRSLNFMARARGYYGHAKAAALIVFVFDRDKIIKYWSQL
ncbi:MAG: helix-hairpin-helix domain-containing protein [Candidatus Omnitrophota bacterium]